jgi:membrane protease YdiL (CAAX protease family)
MRFWTIIGLLVATVGPPALVITSHRLFGERPSLATEFWLQLTLCVLAALVVFIVGLERQSLRSIGLRVPTRATIVTGLVLFVVTFVLLPFLTGPLGHMLGRVRVDAGVARIRAWPIWFRLFVSFTSGPVEETLYRGYLVERLLVWTGRRWLTAGVAILVFGAAHVPTWGTGFAMTADLSAGVLLVAGYLWQRDLIANMAAHTAGLVLQLLVL